MNRGFQILAVAAVVACVGAVGLSVVATNGETADGEQGGFFHHLHQLGQHLHHKQQHAHMDDMAEVIEQLNLTPEQKQRLDKVHELFGGMGGGHSDSMVDLHERLVAQFEQGRIESREIRLVIDDHVEQIRTMAYDVTDELIALVNSLDATQRQTLLDHLVEAREDHGRDH